MAAEYCNRKQAANSTYMTSIAIGLAPLSSSRERGSRDFWRLTPLFDAGEWQFRELQLDGDRGGGGV